MVEQRRLFMKNAKDLLIKLISILLALLIFYIISLYFGHRFLTDSLVGSDTAQALFNTKFIYANFPKVPLWTPEQGGGISFEGLNYGAFFLTALFCKIFSLIPEQGIKIFYFLNKSMVC